MTTILKNRDLYNLLSGRTPQAFNRALKKNFKKANIELSAELWSIIAVLAENDGCSQQLLADKSYRDRPGVTRLVDSLEKLKLVERRPDANDRRLNLVFLTGTGKEIHDKMMTIVDDTAKEAVKGLSDDQITMVKETFQHIYKNLEHY
ncbi:MarR family winged helix-turn-helix transcriptional regulator [Polluticaenibacter yanchengensis]|uniref:MarR family transcriptional regulator n=1 Tax=Polluticaenibacter yanchengensis TaxID=3014562 RepID=A0ABT4UIE4_9BACT|nr:MarR family transcriptional regulator [Chitinophagaceae bacterium LY-5]